MSQSIRDRALSIIELLVKHIDGLALADIASQLEIPKSATHRTLSDLKDAGYIKQYGDGGNYALTNKLLSLGLEFLSRSEIIDVCQPILDELAQETGELIRLAVFDGNDLTWVAKAQGRKMGLKYEPEVGPKVYLPATTNGHAFLAALSEEDALRHLAKQKLYPKGELGINAPSTLQEVLKAITQVRKQGYSLATDMYENGASAIAVVVQRENKPTPIGVISISGPSVRLTKQRLEELIPILKEAAKQLALASVGSRYFNQSH